MSPTARKGAAERSATVRAPAEPKRSHFEPPTIFGYVDAVAAHGSIRKAAEALHVASSAVNRRILDLEGEIGFPLFERLPRGVRPTAAGELFLVYVRRSLKELRQLEAQIDGLRGSDNDVAKLARRYRVLYSVTNSAKGVEVMHSDSTFLFDRAGHAREVMTDTSDAKAVASDIAALMH